VVIVTNHVFNVAHKRVSVVNPLTRTREGGVEIIRATPHPGFVHPSNPASTRAIVARSLERTGSEKIATGPRSNPVAPPTSASRTQVEIRQSQQMKTPAAVLSTTNRREAANSAGMKTAAIRPSTSGREKGTNFHESLSGKVRAFGYPVRSNESSPISQPRNPGIVANPARPHAAESGAFRPPLPGRTSPVQASGRQVFSSPAVPQRVGFTAPSSGSKGSLGEFQKELNFTGHGGFPGGSLGGHR
jgi:hypothetical protein